MRGAQRVGRHVQRRRAEPGAARRGRGLHSVWPRPLCRYRCAPRRGSAGRSPRAPAPRPAAPRRAAEASAGRTWKRSLAATAYRPPTRPKDANRSRLNHGIQQPVCRSVSERRLRPRPDLAPAALPGSTVRSGLLQHDCECSLSGRTCEKRVSRGAGANLTRNRSNLSRVARRRGSSGQLCTGQAVQADTLLRRLKSQRTVDLRRNANPEFAAVILLSQWLGNLLPGRLHVRDRFGNYLPNAQQCLLRCSGQPRQRGELDAQADVLTVLWRPGNAIGVMIRVHCASSRTYRLPAAPVGPGKPSPSPCHFEYLSADRRPTGS